MVLSLISKSRLTLTRVVFEFLAEDWQKEFIYRLTLTRVVFESVSTIAKGTRVID